MSYDRRSFELFVDVTSLDGGELSLVSIEDGTGVVMLMFVSMIVLGDDEFLVLRRRPSSSMWLILLLGKRCRRWS